MFGGVQAVTWTDVKQMVLIVVGLLAAIVVLRARRCRTASAFRRRCGIAGATGRLQTLRLHVRPHEPVHVLVGDDRGALPVLLVLRHRPEPGAALPDGAVGGRGARVAADERLLEDSAAGARAAGRRAGVRVLPLHAAADAVQPRRTTASCARGRARPTTQRSERRFEAAAERAARRPAWRSRRPTPAATPAAGGRGGQAFKEREADVREMRGEALALVREHRRRVVQRRELRLSRRSSRRTCRSASSACSSPRSSRPRCRPSPAEMASLSTATVIDFYRRFARPQADDRHYLRVSRLATGFWGLFASARGGLGRGARLADRGRQPLRVVLLRVDSRRVHPGGRRSRGRRRTARSSA